MARTNDRHPALAVKDAILARSGVYWYTYDEMIQRGIKPTVVKDRYSELRPADVIVRSMDKFPFSVVTVEHTPEETNADNFREQTSGIVGENINAIAMEEGEVALKGKLAFYTKDALDYYEAGHRETSADYNSVVVPNPSGETDYILKEIRSVNGVALTAAGRGGPSVRVLDSKATERSNGGLTVKTRSFFGFGRSKDSKQPDFKLSKVVLDGVTKLRTLDSAKKLDKEAAEGVAKEVFSHVTGFTETETRDSLLSAVAEAIQHPAEYLEKADEYGAQIDTMFSRCRDEDEAAKKALLEKEETDEEKARKAAAAGGNTKDSAAILAEAVEKFTKTVDSLPSLVEKIVDKKLGKDGGDGSRSTDSADMQKLIQAAVRKELGLGDGGEGDKGGDNRSLDSLEGVDVPDDFDLSFAFRK